MKNSYQYLSLFIGIGLLFASTSFVKAESDSESETCSASNEDGNCGGSEGSEGDESQNFWKIGEIGFNKDKLQLHLKELGEEMNSLEMEIVISFLDRNKDRIISQEEFEKILSQRPDLIVQTMLRSFRYLDADDNDGIITFEDLQEALGNSVDTEELVLISLDLDNLPEGKLTILEFLKNLIRLGKDVSTALTPFLNLDHLPPLEAKQAVEGSTKMFKETDADKNGILSKDEYVKAFFRPLPSGKTVTDEQKMAIFATLDKNKDDEISYMEFQALMPQKPKDMMEGLENIFKLTDTNEDGFVTEKELRIHLAEQSKLLNIPMPNDNEIDQTFAKLDVDKDEKLSFEEMSALIGEFKVLQEKKYAEAFQDLDADGDGQLSKEEMITVAKKIEERTNQPIDPDVLTKMIDKDADGIVTFEELQDLIKRFQQPQSS